MRRNFITRKDIKFHFQWWFLWRCSCFQQCQNHNHPHPGPPWVPAWGPVTRQGGPTFQGGTGGTRGDPLSPPQLPKVTFSVTDPTSGDPRVCILISTSSEDSNSQLLQSNNCGTAQSHLMGFFPPMGDINWVKFLCISFATCMVLVVVVFWHLAPVPSL